MSQVPSTDDHAGWIVLKFGGTSVATRKRWTTIAEVIRARLGDGLRVLVVCSAVSGVSNLLERLLRRFDDEDAVRELIADFADRHEHLCDELGVDRSLIAPWLGELQRFSEGARLIGRLTDEVRASIMATGELLSTTIGAHWLTANGIGTAWRDARELLTALPAPVEATQSRRYLSATCDHAPDAALRADLERAEARVVVTQGFIASDAHGQTVLLGRGGSDTSAAYFAARLEAARLEIWTDVPGMFTTNPKDRPDARLLRLIGYEEAQVLAATGARVLHPRCIPPVRDRDIPLHIRCTPAPDMEGTIISSAADREDVNIKAVATRHRLLMIRLSCPGHWHLAGLLADVTTVFKRHGLSIDLLANSPRGISITLDPSVTPLGPIERDNLLRDLEAFGTSELSHQVGSVSLVGSNIGAVVHRLALGLEAAGGRHVHMVSQAAADDGLSLVLDPDDVDLVMNPLHDWLLASATPERVFGPSWAELREQMPPPAA